MEVMPSEGAGQGLGSQDPLGSLALLPWEKGSGEALLVLQQHS